MMFKINLTSIDDYKNEVITPVKPQKQTKTLRLVYEGYMYPNEE